MIPKKVKLQLFYLLYEYPETKKDRKQEAGKKGLAQNIWL